jgi:hypothetical protein
MPQVVSPYYFAFDWFMVTFKALRPTSRVNFGLTKTFEQSALQGALKPHRYRHRSCTKDVLQSIPLRYWRNQSHILSDQLTGSDYSRSCMGPLMRVADHTKQASEAHTLCKHEARITLMTTTVSLTDSLAAVTPRPTQGTNTTDSPTPYLGEGIVS